MAIFEGFVNATGLTPDVLKAACAPGKSSPPTRASVAAMTEHFRSIGYRADVPKLYRALIDYGAAEARF